MTLPPSCFPLFCCVFVSFLQHKAFCKYFESQTQIHLYFLSFAQSRWKEQTKKCSWQFLKLTISPHIRNPCCLLFLVLGPHQSVLNTTMVQTPKKSCTVPEGHKIYTHFVSICTNTTILFHACFTIYLGIIVQSVVVS